MNSMGAPHRMALWHAESKVATIAYQPQRDEWAMAYEPGWLASAAAFPLSPALPLGGADLLPSRSIRWFLENLLPEGRALDIVAANQGISKNSLFGLISVLGAETTGAFRFSKADDAAVPVQHETPLREISLAELGARIAAADSRPLIEWDGRIRMSVAGYQDKLLVFADGAPEQGAAIYLPEYPYASTHILKPQPGDGRMPHLVANEHFCMTLARLIGLPAAEVAILRTASRPVLVVRRFDRIVHSAGQEIRVKRRHLIDGCQACDLPVSHKYERHIGSVGDAALYRDGVSLPMLFGQLQHAVHKSRDKLALLRWVLYQLVIGNADAHGKNFSFYVDHAGLEAAPWYDLVSVTQYPALHHELAMAIGDEFELDQVKGYALADFARRCGLSVKLVKQEAAGIAKRVKAHAATVAADAVYTADERSFIASLASYCEQQAATLQANAEEAARIPAKYL